jgi:uncharacterized protein (TIGR03000 family)
MFSMVLMAALTTGTDMPDLGRRGGRGGCCGGCYGGCMGMGYGGCYGMGRGGGCYGGYGMGMGCGGYGGYGMGWGGGCGGMGWGGGYRGMVWGGTTPFIGNAYVSSPLISTPMYGTALAGAILPAGMTQSFYPNTNAANQGNVATIIVKLPADATLTVDGQPTQSRSDTRTFTSPPLEQGKTYIYTLRAEVNRDGQFIRRDKTVEVQAGRTTRVTIPFESANRSSDEEAADRAPATPPRRRQPANPAQPARSFPTPPPSRP